MHCYYFCTLSNFCMTSLRLAPNIPSCKLRIRISRSENVTLSFCHAFLKFHLKLAGPKPRCAKPGLQRQFSDGDICISVHALYIPANETADGRSFGVKLRRRQNQDRTGSRIGSRIGQGKKIQNWILKIQNSKFCWANYTRVTTVSTTWYSFILL